MAEKLKIEGRQEMSQAELTEELEDADGNVYNRKVRFVSLLGVWGRANRCRAFADLGGSQATRSAIKYRARRWNQRSVVSNAAREATRESTGELLYILTGDSRH